MTASINSVTLVGRLTADPETRQVAGDRTVTTFRLAVSRRGNDAETDYVPVTSWNGTAAAAGTYLSKGRLVAVEGELRHHEWDGADGVKHFRLDVVASNVAFLDPPKAAGS